MNPVYLCVNATNLDSDLYQNPCVKRAGGSVATTILYPTLHARVPYHFLDLLDSAPLHSVSLLAAERLENWYIAIGSSAQLILYFLTKAPFF